MSYVRQEERFGRVTGNTLRRNTFPSYYADQFVSKKRNTAGAGFAPQILPQVNGEADLMDVQLEELINDGDLQGSGFMYSLNKQRRWELPGLLKETICNDDLHQDLNFKVMLVERHLDGQNVFGAACTGLYETQTSQAERLPKRKYAQERDLHKRNDGSKAREEALRQDINKIRCMKNRGGKKVDWRGLMDAMREKMQMEEQIAHEEEDAMAQIRYEITYHRPENKYHWRPEMNRNLCTSKGPRASQKRQKISTTSFLEDTYDLYDIEDDMLNDVIDYSEAVHDVEENADCSQINKQNRPMTTLEDAFIGLTKKSKRSKKRGSKSTLGNLTKKTGTNQASSTFVKKHDKGSFIYDPAAVSYKYLSMPSTRPEVTAAAPTDAQIYPETPQPSLYLLVDHETLNTSRLEADFGKAYFQAQSMPQKFAIEVLNCSKELTENPLNSVYALFEAERDDCVMVECRQPEKAHKDWQMVKKGIPMRMTLYGRVDGLNTNHLIENMAALFSSTVVFSIQEIMIYLTDEIKMVTSCNRVQIREIGASSRLISSDIPTVRAAFGWYYSFSSADDAYRDIKSSQVNQSGANTVPGAIPAAWSDTCGICCESLAPSTSASRADGAANSVDNVMEGTSLTACGHNFCNDCWRRYLSSGVQQGVTDITCPEYNCKIPVDPVTAMAFLSPAQFHAHYRRSRDTTLASSTKWHRCPNPHCGRIALVQLSQSDFVSHNGEAVAVRCGCGWLWCTQCKEPAHWPASCKQAETYRPLVKKRVKIIQHKVPLVTQVEVRICPGCRTRWEKNGGCPYMICGNCGLPFCWNCLQPFKTHDYDLCERTVTQSKVIHLNFPTSTKDFMTNLAVEYHKKQYLTTLTKSLLSAAKLASKSIMLHLSTQDAAKFHFQTSFLLSSVATARVSQSNKLFPLTWARTQEDLDIMRRKEAQCFDIAVFCHETNFVLEHLTFFLWGKTRRQRKAKWWNAMFRLRFITGHLEETLTNLQTVKKSETAATLDRLCHMMHAGKKCLRQLAHSISVDSNTKSLPMNTSNKTE